MTVICTIGSDGRKFYFKDGKRIAASKVKNISNIICSPKSSKKKSSPKSPSKSSSKRQSRKKPKSPSKKKPKSPSKKKPKSPSKSSPRRRSRKKPESELKPCKEYQYRDPVTRRCNNNPEYKRKSRSKSDKELEKKCKDHQYFDPVTRRCKNKPDYKRKRTKKDQPDLFLNKERWIEPATSPSCLSDSKFPFRDIQEKVVKFMEDHNSLLVVHGTGCGKTLTSIGVAECYLRDNPNDNIIIISPASLTANYKKEMNKFNIRDKSKYKFYSFDKFLFEEKKGNPVDCNNTLLIVDEAHNLRNYTGKKSLAVLNCAKYATKRLLLTATPFVNKFTDLIPLINYLYGGNIVGTKMQFYEDEAEYWISDSGDEFTFNTIKFLLYDKVDVVDCKDPEFFPERIDERIYIPMSEEYFSRYVRLMNSENVYGIQFSNPEKFYNGHRRAVNKTGYEYYSEKIRSITPMLKQGKTLLYTNWIDFGIEPITSALKREGITYKVFSGSISKSKRARIVQEFNNNEFEVLVITRAGGEGLDLLEVRNVIILDPTWNDAGLQQIIGRAIRYKSHYYLPKEEQKVYVYTLVLTEPNIDEIDEEDKSGLSGDRILYNIIGRKISMNEKLYEILEDVSI